MVDEAYAEGRITAADRALRLEQIDAAATKGDLAMVLRDLEGRPPSSTSPDLGAPPFGMPAPVADLDPVAPTTQPAPTTPPAPSALPPVTSSAPASTPGSGGPSWAPPSYGGSGSDSGSGSGRRTGGWTTERTIGCGVVAVIAIFLVPLVIAVVVFLGVARSFDGGFDSGSSDDIVVADDGGYTEKDGVTVPDAAAWWDTQVTELDDSVGAATVTAFDVRDGSGVATVVDGTTTRQWVFAGAAWEPVGEPAMLDPAASPVDLADIDPTVVQDVVETTLLQVGPDASPDVQLHVVTSGGAPRLVVEVTDGSTTTRGTFALDGTPIE